MTVLEWTPPTREHAHAVASAYHHYLQLCENSKDEDLSSSFEPVVDWLRDGGMEEEAPEFIPRRADGTAYIRHDFCPAGHEVVRVMHEAKVHEMADLPSPAGPVYWYTSDFADDI